MLNALWLGVVGRVLDVVLRGSQYARLLFRRHVPLYLARHAEHKRAGGDLRALCHKGARAYYAVLADLGVIEDDGAHAYEAPVLYGAAVEDDAVAYGYVISEDKRVGVLCDVQGAVVLDVCPLADAYVVDVTAHDRVEPDARAGAYLDVAYNLGAIFYERALIYPGQYTLVRLEHLYPRNR